MTTFICLPLPTFNGFWRGAIFLHFARVFTLVLSLVGITLGAMTPTHAFDFNQLKEEAQRIQKQAQQVQDARDKAIADQKALADKAAALEKSARDNPIVKNLSQPSSQEERTMGKQVAGSLLGAAPLVNDRLLQIYVNQVGRWVASHSTQPNLEWQFGVIESKDMNAFAAPGGYIFLTKGLYQNLRDESQLAGVLGHEIAHVVQKHHIALLQKSELLNQGADIAQKIIGEKKIKDLIGSGAEMLARGLDKDAELEADRIGLALAARAGYEPYGLPQVLNTLSEISAVDASMALLYATHPTPVDRLNALSIASNNRLDRINENKTLREHFYLLPH